MEKEKRIAFAGPWIGEFGWEIMTWVPYLRKLSREYDKMIISTFPGMEVLYTGFHCEVDFSPHTCQERTDNWEGARRFTISPEPVTNHISPIKEYRVDGEYIRYGSPVIKDAPVLFHSRGIGKGAFKNWSIAKWNTLAKAFPQAGSIGSPSDMCVLGTEDRRGMPLPELMNVLTSASIVIGQSSGVMHLAVMCGTPVVVWGDDTLMNFGESLETRYKETWNPFRTPVTWIHCDNPWDPEPEQIIDAMKPQNAPDTPVLDAIRTACESGHYVLEIAYIGQKGGKDVVFSKCFGHEFPDIHLEQAEKQMISNIQERFGQAKAERRPVSWR